MRYTILTGGHEPGHLRGDFAETLEEFYGLGAPDPDTEEVAAKLDNLCGQLWNCSDILSSGVRYMLDGMDVDMTARRNTYASAARALRSYITDERMNKANSGSRP